MLTASPCCRSAFAGATWPVAVVATGLAGRNFGADIVGFQVHDLRSRFALLCCALNWAEYLPNSQAFAVSLPLGYGLFVQISPRRPASFPLPIAIYSGS